MVKKISHNISYNSIKSAFHTEFKKTRIFHSKYNEISRNKRHWEPFPLNVSQIRTRSRHDTKNKNLKSLNFKFEWARQGEHVLETYKLNAACRAQVLAASFNIIELLYCIFLFMIRLLN